MTTRYDHPDSAAVRAEAAREPPANQGTRPDEARFAKRYDHADSRQGREPAKPPASASTAAGRLARRYDHPDSQAGRDESRQNLQVARERARLGKFYDHPDSQQGRPPVHDMADEPPGTPAAAAERTGEVTLQAPEGFDGNDPAFREFANTARELRLDQKAANRLLQLHQKAMVERNQQVERQAEAWRAELANDSEVSQHADAARELLGEYGGPEVQQLFEQTWLGDHPALVRFIVKVARELKEARR